MDVSIIKEQEMLNFRATHDSGDSEGESEREITCKGNRTDIENVKIRREAVLYSDHYLLRARIRMKSRRERISIHVGGEKQKINTSIKSHKLGENEIAKKFKECTE